jgi:tetratricopeptide (TPR) repeat protein
MLPFATAGAGPGETPGAASQYIKPAAPWVVAWVTGLVNEQNGQLDDAIKNFELILSDDMNENPAVKSRGFDFRRDFVVWNELGTVRFERAEQERGAKRAAERERRLREAVDAFEHTLDIDPEDLTAHYNLALLYGILSGNANDAVASSITATAQSLSVGNAKVVAADLQRLFGELLASDASAARTEALEKLTGSIQAFLAGERDPFESRLNALVGLLEKCRDAYRMAQGNISKPEPAAAIARVLTVLHRELHLIYKLDDNAREAVAIHRQNNAAANHAAQSIVIYPLNRPGAPGLADRPKTTQRPASEGGL